MAAEFSVSSGGTSVYDGADAEAWVLQVQDAPERTYNHFRNVLMHASESGVLDSATLSTLLDMVDNFVIPVPDGDREDSVYTDDEEDDESSDNNSALQHSSMFSAVRLSRGQRLGLIAKTMEHPLQGVKISRQRYRLRTYRGVFTGKDAVSWIMSRQYADSREEALEMGRKVLEHGHFRHVTGQRTLEDSSHHFYRFTSHPEPLSIKMPASCQKPTLNASLLRLVYAVHDGDIEPWLRAAQTEHLKVAFPALVMWMGKHPEATPAVVAKLKPVADRDGSLLLYLHSFHVANNIPVPKEAMEAGHEGKISEEMHASVAMLDNPPPGAEVKKLQAAGRRIQHPFTDRLVVPHFEKEFTSAAKPCRVSFHDPDSGERVLPDAMCKCGDDLSKDLGVQLIFQAAAAFWEAADVQWRCGVPTVGTVRVLATGAAAGYLEFVEGRTVKEVAEQDAWKDVDLHKLAPSVVGSLMSGFVMGVRDRHSENFMLLGDPKEDPRLIQIDFGYMLMEAPGGLALDTPRLTLQPQLIKLLRAAPGHNDKHSLLEYIQSDLIVAYRVLREHYAAFVSFARVALANVYPETKVTGHLWGAHAFRAGQSEEKATAWVADKVMTQLTETNFRRGAKHAIVRAYYGVKKLT